MVYLAIDYGCYEGWRLEEFKDVETAMGKVKDGSYSGSSGWKILREIDLVGESKEKTDEQRFSVIERRLERLELFICTHE